MAAILCVEDETELREEIVDVLREEGHEIFSAENGFAALEKLTAEVIDLVVSDINMPEMDGHELLQAVRELGSAQSRIPFIFLTALADKEHVVHGLNQGALGYLTKPVDFELLIAKTNAALREIESMQKYRAAEHDELRKLISDTLR